MKNRSKLITLMLIAISLIACNTDDETNTKEIHQEVAVADRTVHADNESSEPASGSEMLQETTTEEEIPVVIRVGQNATQINLDEAFNVKDIELLTAEMLVTLKNGIYAKHGYRFKSPHWKEVFSSFEWYEATSDNVEAQMTSLDHKNIALIDKQLSYDSIVFHFSEDDQRLAEDLVLDNPPVSILVESLEEIDYRNKPVRITLSTNESSEVFESLFNDNVYIGITDFDTEDEYSDIFILETGTDVGCYTYIYRTNGREIYKYTHFEHIYSEFVYDKSGKIYYRSPKNNTWDYDYNYIFDYNANESYEILIERLKMNLMLYSSGK